MRRGRTQAHENTVPVAREWWCNGVTNCPQSVFSRQRRGERGGSVPGSARFQRALSVWRPARRMRALEFIVIGGANSIGYSMLNGEARRRPADVATDAFVHYLQSTQEP